MKKIIIRIIKDIKTFWVGIAIIVSYYFITNHFFHASCPFILLTGFPCPGCGLTRSVFNILTFDFESAIIINPISFAWVAFFIYFIFVRYILGKNTKIVSAITNVLIILICLTTLVFYIYNMINYFPNKIPYVYTRRNLMYYLLHRN